MAFNFVQEISKPIVARSTSATVKGEPLNIEDLMVIPDATLASNSSGQEFSANIFGVYRVAKEAASSGKGLSFGDKVYWDATNKRATTTSTNNKALGYVVRNAATTDEEVEIALWQLN